MANVLFNSIDAFAEEVSKAVAEKTGSKVDVNKVNKTNGIVLTGLSIRGNNNIAPTVYLENFFESYNEGVSIDVISDKIIEVTAEHSVNCDFDVTMITNWNQASKEIRMKLINLERNEDFLTNVPHLIFGDLAIIFQVVLGDSFFNGDGIGTVTVYNQLLATWGKTTKELYEVAKKPSVEIESMFNVMLEMMGDVSSEELEMMGIIDNGKVPMYVMSNKTKLNGAIALIVSESLESFAKEHGSFFIIPSSIHELLLVPIGETVNEEFLTDMVQEVNEQCVSNEEILSDHAYYYDAETFTLYTELGGDVMQIVAA